MANSNDDLARIQEEIEALERATLETSRSLRNLSNIPTSTPVPQSTLLGRPRRSDSGINSRTFTKNAQSNVQDERVRFGVSDDLSRREMGDSRTATAVSREPYDAIDHRFSERTGRRGMDVDFHKYEPGVTYLNDLDRQATDSRRSHNYIKPATFDGSGSWVDYKSHFEACSSLNQWTDREKGLYLSVSLRGQAMSVLGNLSKQSVKDYEEIVVALEDRVAPAN